MNVQHEWSIAQLKGSYAAGQRVFQGIEIATPDGSAVVSELSLCDACFVDCWFHSATFQKVNLSGASFRGCNLKCAVFDGCNLDNTLWEHCAVCSLVVHNCATANIIAAELDAYGYSIDGAAAFVQYGLDNGNRKGGAANAL